MSNTNALTSQALVLGGGGVAGIAWMTGLLYGFEEEGVNLRDRCNVFIGTSAGSTVAAQLASDTPLHELFQRQVDPARQVSELLPAPQLLERVGQSLPGLFKLADPRERLSKIGEFAATAATISEAERRQVIAQRLSSHEWSDRVLKIVAIDIATGQTRVFDRQAGVNLIDAVAASCAVPGLWPPVTIGQQRYMDGGVRCSDNADLALGSSSVIVLSPQGTHAMVSPGGMDLSTHVAALREQGAQVWVVEPDEAARQAMGRNPLSPDTRTPAAQTGRAQARALAPTFRASAHG